jgi:allantoinase
MNSNTSPSKSQPHVPPFAVRSSRIVTPRGEIDGSIIIENGKITQVIEGDGVPNGLTCQNHGNLVIFPGLVDSHVHINDPGTDWEGFKSATQAAAAGGVTTLIDMPLNSLPVTTDVNALQAKRDASKGKLHVDVGFHGGIVPGNELQIPWLLDQGVLGFKAFLCDSGLEQFPASGETELRAAIQHLRSRGVPLLAHAEIVSEVEDFGFNDVTSYQQYVNSRPPLFELEAIRLLIDLCREFHTPIHIVHLATAEAFPVIEAAKREGLPLTVETCPHYLFFSAVNVVHRDTRFKCAPPIRHESNRLALCDAVASGLIDTIGSDHSPCPIELKTLDTGDFTKAWGGIAGLQLTLPASWTVLQDHGMTLTQLAHRTASRPAEIFGLSNRKGKIEVGYDADLVIWNPHERFLVDLEDLYHWHQVTPYESCAMKGAVECTMVRGHVVFNKNEQPAHAPPVGQTLTHSDSQPDSIAIHLDSLTPTKRESVLQTCCASRAWVKRMNQAGKFGSDANVLLRAQRAASNMIESDWLEAFDAHPRIGDVDSLKKKYANTLKTAGSEQSGVAAADNNTLKRLAVTNETYFKKFGFIFIVFATGKSASEMLALLEERLPNDRATEIENAAAEQLKITLLRLRNLAS